MYDILSAAQAAKVIGCKPEKVQLRILQGDWPIGQAIEVPGQTKRNYEINRYALARFLEISDEEVSRRLAGRDRSRDLRRDDHGRVGDPDPDLACADLRSGHDNDGDRRKGGEQRDQ